MKLNKTISIIILTLAVLSGLFLFYRHIEEKNGVNYSASIKKLITEKEMVSETASSTGDNDIGSPVEAAMIKMFFFGDLMLDRHVKERMGDKGVSYVLESLDKNLFAGKDLVSANLEGAVTDAGSHYDPFYAYDFAFAPALIKELKDYNFNFFNLANNHFSDQGDRGMIETRKNLDGLGIDYSGCKDKETGGCSGVIINIGGKKAGLTGFSMVYGKFDMAAATGTIANLRSEADLVVVNIHWGEEYQHDFNATQQAVGRSLIDAGADIIIGHHPHVVQGIEIYKGRPIFYSLGNFIFDQYFSPDTQEGLAVEADWEGDKINFRLYPLKSKMSRVELMSEEDKEKFFQKLKVWSKNSKGCEKDLERGEFIIEFK